MKTSYSISSAKNQIIPWIKEIRRRHLHYQEGMALRLFRKECSGKNDISKMSVAKIEGQVIGWACLFYGRTYHPRIMVYVQTKFRNHGIGRKLLNAAKGTRVGVQIPAIFRRKKGLMGD